MLAYVLRRLVISILVVLGASFVVFVLVANSGNPLAMLEANPHVSPATIHARELQLHLNDPVLVRYGIWLGGIFHGTLGDKLNGQAVAPLLWSRLFITMRMILPTIAISLVVAVAIGVVSSVRQYSATDYVSTGLSFLFLSTPVFVVGILLKEFVAIPLNKKVGHVVLYTVGEQNPLLTGGFLSRVPDYMAHTVLPVITLVLITYAAWSRYQRASMLEVLNSDYVRLARAKGLSPRRVLVRHVLRNALIPLTTVVALDFAVLWGGAIVTEQVFGWDAMGQFLLQGIEGLDINVVQAWLLVTAVMVVIFNLLADILYAYLDPRIRYG
ncbi:MAG: ABC transporter permease [Acidimicrobiales bacterium]